MRNIPLTQGKFALVDDADYEKFSRYKWYAKKDVNTFYAARNIRENGKRKTVLMHRAVLGEKNRFHIDHRDGNGLNNQRLNLRKATHTENQWNSKIRSDNSSGFKGVYWFKNSKKWCSQIMVNGRKKYLGLFFDELEAARIYDQAAKKYHGEFAKLNFIN